jgi:acyl carrier protein
MERLYEILEDIQPDVDFETEEKLVDNHLLSSLSILALIAELEDEFDITIPAIEIDGVFGDTTRAAVLALQRTLGLTEDGIASDTSIMENSVRKIMIKNSRKSYILCDKSKLGKTYLNTICNIKDIAGVISD